MDLLNDEDAAVQQVAEATNQAVGNVAEYARWFRHAVDKLAADNFSIVAPPLMRWRDGDPVMERMLGLVKHPEWTPTVLEDLPSDELAQALGLKRSTIDAFPVAWGSDVLGQVCDDLQIPEGDRREDDVGEVLQAWLETFEDEARVDRYRVAPVGLERDFEDWLESNLDRLKPFGFDLQLGSGTARARGGRQWRFADRQRPDMICRVKTACEHLRPGDWVVIENKATAAGSHVLEQLERYIVNVRLNLADVSGGEQVWGLLLADGTTVNLQLQLNIRGIGYVSLAALGYRDHVFSNRRGAAGTTNAASGSGL